MLKFNTFLKEQDESLDIDSRHVNNNVDNINAALDELTEKPYQNAPIFLAQLRGALERFGILLPSTATKYFLDLSAEVVYLLGDSLYQLYIVYDTNDEGFVDGYAQLVDNSELQDLLNMNPEDLLDDEDEVPTIKYPPARRDDDSGNTSEY
jgi:hypothetical protein